MRNTVQVTVPASTANLGPGFDTIGMAFQLYTTIRMTVSDRPEVIMHGDQLHELPTDQTNLVYQMAELIFNKITRELPPLRIEMKSDIPLTRGLGSSATAIVGGLVAANFLAGEPLSKEEILSIAAELEGHPDNVGAALFGGIVVAVMEEERVPYLKISPDPQLKALAVIPDFQLSTEKARNVLPQQYSKQDTVFSVGRASLLAAGLASGQYHVLASAMQDKLHQPYRMSLVPGMEELLQGVYEYGALGAALSGAGPTVIALLHGEDDELGKFMQETLLKHEIQSKVLRLLPDRLGARVEVVDTPFETE
ncbi:homoserine kinase [Ammoniphilus oxalaticus]|uniref:Homoserine kinase n=1 Tax=Ammoniphilus oxalaticus TaxID=66863 RepID=A0A419SIR9_9BACL|nr:homoserine kinase [Ammoniphilus oxalaticus]RKD23911.1 homoserine kinase [Ammoniphilus oxalaticus]